MKILVNSRKIIANNRQKSAIIANNCKLLPIIANYYQLSQIIADNHKLSPIITNYPQYLQNYGQ